MNTNLLIARDQQEWDECARLIDSALMTVASLIGLRQYEVAEVKSITVSALLNDDCRLLKNAQPAKVQAFIASIAQGRARNYIKSRRRYERRFISMSEHDLELTESLN